MLRAVENVITGLKEVMIEDRLIQSCQQEGQIQKDGKCGGKERCIYISLPSPFLSKALPPTNSVGKIKLDALGHGYH